jgi:hypothetical protein
MMWSQSVAKTWERKRILEFHAQLCMARANSCNRRIGNRQLGIGNWQGQTRILQPANLFRGPAVESGSLVSVSFSALTPV